MITISKDGKPVIRFIHESEKAKSPQFNTITEKIYCEKNQVVHIEYKPNHRPTVRVFAGV